MNAIQLDFIEQADPEWETKSRLTTLEKQGGNLRRGIFARHDLLVKEMLLLWGELERLKERVP